MSLTAGSPLAKDARQSSWADVEHPLCGLHVIQDVHKLSRAGVRAITNRLKRQGPQGGTKRRGLPSKPAPHQRQRRGGRRKKEPATCIWAHQSLMVQTPDDLREQDKENLACRWQMAPTLTLWRPGTQPLSRLFAKGLTSMLKQSVFVRRVSNKGIGAWSTYCMLRRLSGKKVHLTPTLSQREGRPLSWAPSADAVAGRGRTRRRLNDAALR